MPVAWGGCDSRLEAPRGQFREGHGGTTTPFRYRVTTSGGKSSSCSGNTMFSGIRPRKRLFQSPAITCGDICFRTISIILGVATALARGNLHDHASSGWCENFPGLLDPIRKSGRLSVGHRYIDRNRVSLAVDENR